MGSVTKISVYEGQQRVNNSYKGFTLGT